MGRSLAMFRRWKNEFLTVFWTWGSKVRLMSNIKGHCFNSWGQKNDKTWWKKYNLQHYKTFRKKMTLNLHFNYWIKFFFKNKYNYLRDLTTKILNIKIKMPKWFFLDIMSVHKLLFFPQIKFIYKEINETETDCMKSLCNLANFKDQEEKLFKTISKQQDSFDQ